MNVYADHYDLPVIDLEPIERGEHISMHCVICGERCYIDPEEPGTCPGCGAQMITVGRSFLPQAGIAMEQCDDRPSRHVFSRSAGANRAADLG